MTAERLGAVRPSPQIKHCFATYTHYTDRRPDTNFVCVCIYMKSEIYACVCVCVCVCVRVIYTATEAPPVLHPATIKVSLCVCVSVCMCVCVCLSVCLPACQSVC